MSLNFSQLLPIQHFPVSLEADLELLQQRVEEHVLGYVETPGAFDGSDLNSMYWEAVELLIKARAFDTNSASLEMIDREQLLVNFGILDERLLPEGTKVDTLIRAQLQNNTYFIPILYFSEVLEERYVKIVNAEEYQQALSDLERFNAAYKLAKATLTDAIELRTRSIGSAPNAEKLETTLRGLDEAFPYFSRLSVIMTDKRYQKTEKTVSEYRKLRVAYSSLKNTERDLLTSAGLSTSAQDAIRDVNTKHTTLVRLQLSIEFTRDKVQILKAEMDASNRNTRHEKILEVMLDIQKVSQSFSQRILRVGLVQVLNKNIAVNDRETVQTIVQQVMDTDTRYRKKLKEMGPKSLDVCILPGIGEALVEPRQRRVWLPLMFAFEKHGSLIAALGELRYDIFPGCSQAYRTLTHTKELKSDVVLRKHFGEDYSIFLENTSKGFRKLPSEVHGFFVEYVLRGKGEEPDEDV